jgi:haloalkane dehalogenase
MSQSRISTDFPYESRFVEIAGSKMHYIEQGAGDPILFLHGIPASNYVWRNVIPHLATLGRCIAPDLIGFGKSDKPDIAYSISDHIRYIEKFIDELKLKKLTIVMHGWGSIIGFDYAMKHEKNCKGLAFYEAFLRPFHEEDISLPFQEHVSELEAQEFNMEKAINGIQFIDQVLPQAMMRTLSETEMSHYREPFLEAGSEKPLQQYWQELSQKNGSGEVDKIITEYAKKLTQSKLPKLLLYSIPGFVMTIATVMWAKKHLTQLEIVEIGEDLHYAQESNPFLMGESISIWLQGVEQMV